MKKGPLEFKQPKFWEERDGGLIPAHRTVSFAKCRIEIQGRSIGAGLLPSTAIAKSATSHASSEWPIIRGVSRR
jgi:hypothetical protein